jgi:hypothetical protein
MNTMELRGSLRTDMKEVMGMLMGMEEARKITVTNIPAGTTGIHMTLTKRLHMRLFFRGEVLFRL